MMLAAVRAALVVGAAIDLFVGIVLLVVPQLAAPLFDVSVRDGLVASFAGSELIVAACVYALTLRDPQRYRVFLWVCALDQFFAVVGPSIAVADGAMPATWKVIAPIPLQAVLCVLFVFYAARPGRNASATPFMQ